MCQLCKNKCHHKLEDKTFKNVKVCRDLTLKGQLIPVHKIRKLNKCDIKRRGGNGTVDQRYDTIVVGAGTASCLLIYRLAERYPNMKILVLETGQDDTRLDTSTVPGGLPAIPNPNPGNGAPGVPTPPIGLQDPWGQLIRSIQGTLGEGCHCSMAEIFQNNKSQTYQTPIGYHRGYTIGGTSAHNGFVWNRGTKEGTYDLWEEQTGDAEFGFTGMLDAYKKVENRTTQFLFLDKTAPLNVYANAVNRYWAEPGPTPGTTLNPYMGTAGRMPLTGFGGRPELFGTMARAVDDVLATKVLPGRTGTIPILLADVNFPADPPGGEYSYVQVETHFDQTDPNFPSINPYKANAANPTPTGSTYTSPSGVALGPEYGAPVGPPFPLPKFNIVRAHAGDVYMYPILDNLMPHSVTVKQRAWVTSLLFTNPKDSLECTGVEWVEGPNGEGWHVEEQVRAIDRDQAPYAGTVDQVDRSKCSILAAVENQKNVTYNQAYAKGDIWVCAGVLNSPGILQRAGIADREFLNSVGIPVRFDLPGVGQNAQETVSMAVNFYTEEDLSSGLGVATSPPSWSSNPPNTYPGNYWANPSDPLNPVWDGTIQAAPIGSGAQVRVKTDPSKKFPDGQFFAFFPGIGRVENGTLYGDLGNLATGGPTHIDILGKARAQKDFAQWGMWNAQGSSEWVTTNSFLCSLESVSSRGSVEVISSSPFEPVNYMPNMMGDEADLNAMNNLIENSFFPILQGLAEQRYGFRGPATYYGDVAGTQVANTEIKLASTLLESKPILGNIDQATYDTPGSLVDYTVLLVQGTGSGLAPDGGARVITAWTGAPAYVATVAVPYSTLPVGPADTKYILNPPHATVIDSVTFDTAKTNNRRNFVRMANPSNDDFFSPISQFSLAANPLTTTAGNTRIRVSQPSHGFSTGDMIKLSGVVAFDSIAADELNNYHVVYVVDANSYDIILFWNQTPLQLDIPGPPTYGAPAPNPAAGAVGAVGGGASVIVQGLRMDRLKFSQYIREHIYGGYHGCSSCRMGKVTDATAVVDTRARVYNFLGLRVCDSSIFPAKPNGNTQAPLFALAQKIFDLVSVEEYDGLFL